MFSYANEAVDAAVAAGARYSDARVVVTRSETIDVKNQTVESVDHGDSIGLGVRALIGSSWGFYAVADLSEASAREAGRRAADIAKASALVAGPHMELADVPVSDTSYETPHDEDPFGVSLGLPTSQVEWTRTSAPRMARQRLTSG